MVFRKFVKPNEAYKMYAKPTKSVKPAFQCDICCEYSSKAVACPVCVKEACTFCVRRYILSQPTEAQCMHCHAVWDRDVLIQLLPKAFVNGDYKRHREQMLYEQCRAMLPGLQQRAQNTKAARALEAINRDMRVRLTALHEQHNRIRNTLRAESFVLKYYDDNTAIKQQTENRIKVMLQDKNRLFNETLGIQRTINENSRVIQYILETGEMPGVQNGTPQAPREPPRFIRGCPAADCRGFMGETGSQLVCGVCSLEACAKCHEPLLCNGTHVCRKENIETAKLLKKDTRPCPKCSVPIFKVNGCDQMWCVLCQTTFSWNTGEISEGHVHNPHYYEWMRQNQRVIPREPGDVPHGAPRCDERDGIVALHRLRDWLSKVSKDPYANDALYELVSIHRYLVHLTRVEIPRFTPETQRERLFQKPLVAFLLNELSENDLKKQLQKKDKENQQKRGVQQVLHMLVAASGDVFHTTLEAHPEPTMETAVELKKQLNTIRVFANEALFRHKAIYNYTPWVVNERWALMTYTKYTKEQEA